MNLALAGLIGAGLAALGKSKRRTKRKLKKTKDKLKKSRSKSSRRKKALAEFKNTDVNNYKKRKKLSKDLYDTASTKSEKDQAKVLYKKEAKLDSIKEEISTTSDPVEKKELAKDAKKVANEEQKEFWEDIEENPEQKVELDDNSDIEIKTEKKNEGKSKKKKSKSRKKRDRDQIKYEEEDEGEDSDENEDFDEDEDFDIDVDDVDEDFDEDDLEDESED